ncbi:RHS repeat domain-containing protein [Xanthomonas oryzae]|uniref:RHS repeat domain-containing protein n=1 Tax=Xanthomonas oryzae TaxID=347 RepID=UPI000949E6B2|nr:RHS repeat domain-containing protein [Xanthomonas oryzae]UXW14152.1 RHS repeat protein [Xanthomonas oryzae pv. oryzae]WAY25932.1 RHS repeat protein [Xanthomonas oryzae pv. oryzae]
MDGRSVKDNDEMVGAKSCKAFRLARSRIGKLLLLASLLLVSLATLATNYLYDGSGKLVSASDDSGASARYTYDSMGNLLAVDRFAAGQLAIFTVNPGRGAPGTIVID